MSATHPTKTSVFSNLWFTLLAAMALSVTITAFSIAYSRGPEFDRLDGHGPSGKRVDVIEWAENLEIHVYPKGSLAGLALKLDKKNADKPVMVIGYRFNNHPKEQLIRRAILGITLYENFKIYQDPTEEEFDKIIISNNSLAGELVAYRPDPEPTKLYPEDPRENPEGEQKNAADRAIASENPPTQASPSHQTYEVRDPRDGKAIETTPPKKKDANGTIQPFHW